MNFLKGFQERIFSVAKGEFEALALELYEFQRRNNPVYKSYLQQLGIMAQPVTDYKKIPFLPIEFFKHHRVTTGEWQEQCIFQSSGTTDQVSSKKYVQDTGFYDSVAIRIFESLYGPLSGYHILALLPSYLERGNSSLVYMVDSFIKASGSEHSGFYLSNYAALAKKLGHLATGNRKVLLIGVTYALLDLVENFEVNTGANNLMVMETGGMKGRRKEMIREELHDILCAGFGLEEIHSEYGMTELTSQAYAGEKGKFRLPPWVRVRVRDINDPFDVLPGGRTGGLNIIDLANVATCAFIETRDLGKLNPDGTVEVLGRFDNSEMRGCNLLVG